MTLKTGTFLISGLHFGIEMFPTGERCNRSFGIDRRTPRVRLHSQERGSPIEARNLDL